VTDVTASFATPRVAAGVLFRDDAGRVLLVKPSYKPGWEIPGGYVERSESPLAAAVREVNEELGVHVALTDLLVLDWAPHPDEGDKLLVIFRGGVLTADDVAAFQLKADEIVEAKFFDVAELGQLMPNRLARRVAQAAAEDHSTYLEHGQSPVSPSG
jgi:8-oxo-dGTP pyrophosphatase MutT (NUDIX family)